MNAPTLNQQQMEALADILVLAMYADGHVSVTEDDDLNAKIDALDWNENHSPSQYLGTSTAKARDADTPEKVMDALSSCAEVLADYDAKEYAFKKTMELLKSDGLSDEEGFFVHQLRQAFGV